MNRPCADRVRWYEREIFDGAPSGREIFDGLSKGLSVNRPCADRVTWGDLVRGRLS